MAGMTASDDFDPDEDFYEEDEPLQDVIRAYEHGVHGVTAPPTRIDLELPAVLVQATTSAASPTRITVGSADTTPIEVLVA